MRERGILALQDFDKFKATSRLCLKVRRPVFDAGVGSLVLPDPRAGLAWTLTCRNLPVTRARQARPRQSQDLAPLLERYAQPLEKFMLSAYVISTHNCALVQRPKPKTKPAEEPAPAREHADARPQGSCRMVDPETCLIVQEQSRSANLPSLAAQGPVHQFSLPFKA